MKFLLGVLVICCGLAATPPKFTVVLVGKKYSKLKLKNSKLGTTALNLEVRAEIG